MNLDNIKKDHIYNELYEKHGFDYIVEAGYYESDTHFTSLSDDEINETLYITCTPIPSLSQLKQENAVILLTTGCFNPVHDYHIKMMESATSKLFMMGLNPIACYYAPDHDNYVKQKSPDNYLNIFDRSNNIYNKIKDRNLFDHFVDPWAGVYINHDVNFTTIYRRLQLYIKKYTGIDVPIYYVCGSDRANFSLSFPNRTIVAQRYETNFTPIDNKYEKYSITSNLDKNYISSTLYRKYIKLIGKKKKNLHLRHIDGTHIFERYCIFKKYFNDIFISNFIENKNTFYNITRGKNIISLDKEIKGDYNINVSRYYNLGGTYLKNILSSPKSESLSIQINKIDKGKSYFLFDDDTYNGLTIKTIKKYLKQYNITINGVYTLINGEPDNCEILDYNDFYIHENYGLCILTPDGRKIRFPYLMPFVNVNKRCSILNPIEFSIEMWRIIYKEVPDDHLIKTHEKYSFLNYVGFDKNENVRNVINKIIKDLNNAKSKTNK